MIKRRKGVPKKLWSSDEEQLLKEMYADYTLKVSDIASALNRSRTSVMGKANILGLTKITIKDVQVDEGFKICSKCFNVKPLNDFYKNKNKKFGVDSYCKCCCADIRNSYLIRKAEQKVLQEQKEKEDFINENKHLTFKCSTCKNYYKITDFSVYKTKEGKIKRNSLCKKCNAENMKIKHYRMYADKGYR